MKKSTILTCALSASIVVSLVTWFEKDHNANSYDAESYAFASLGIKPDPTIDFSDISDDSTKTTDTTSSDSSQQPVDVNGHNISIGMSIEEVKNELGNPYEDNKTIVSGDTSDQLVYRNLLGAIEFYIYCDNGVVTGIQDSL